MSYTYEWKEPNSCSLYNGPSNGPCNEVTYWENVRVDLYPPGRFRMEPKKQQKSGSDIPKNNGTCAYPQNLAQMNCPIQGPSLRTCGNGGYVINKNGQDMCSSDKAEIIKHGSCGWYGWIIDYFGNTPVCKKASDISKYNDHKINNLAPAPSSSTNMATQVLYNTNLVTERCHQDNRNDSTVIETTDEYVKVAVNLHCNYSNNGFCHDEENEKDTRNWNNKEWFANQTIFKFTNEDLRSSSTTNKFSWIVGNDACKKVTTWGGENGTAKNVCGKTNDEGFVNTEGCELHKSDMSFGSVHKVEGNVRFEKKNNTWTLISDFSK